MCGDVSAGGAMSYFAVGTSAEKRFPGDGNGLPSRDAGSAHIGIDRAPAPFDLSIEGLRSLDRPSQNGDQRAELRSTRRWPTWKMGTPPHWKNVMSSQLALADAVRRD
jgi:hypothetical protein